MRWARTLVTSLVVVLALAVLGSPRMPAHLPDGVLELSAPTFGPTHQPVSPVAAASARAAPSMTLGPGYAPRSLPAPWQVGAGVHASTINVTWNTVTCGSPPPEARAALSYAADIWESLISSAVPIEATACWSNMLGADALGTGMPATYTGNFASAPLVDTNYPIALANALASADLAPGYYDAELAFSSTASWYFATSGALPMAQWTSSLSPSTS